MKITNKQLKLFAKLLSKKEKQEVANKAKVSYSSLESLIYGHRHNKELAEYLYAASCKKLEHLLQEKEIIEFVNRSSLTEKAYQIQKNDIIWNHSENYLRYMDIYLELIHLELKEAENVMGLLLSRYRYFLKNPYYCIDLITKLTGCTVKHAIKIFKEEQKKHQF